MLPVKAMLDDADDFRSESYVVTVNGSPVMVDVLISGGLIGTEFERAVRNKEVSLAVASHCRVKFGPGRVRRTGKDAFVYEKAARS